MENFHTKLIDSQKDQDSIPLKILLVTSQPLWNPEREEEIDALDIEEERRTIYSSLKSLNCAIELCYLSECSVPNFFTALQGNWDIIHISAHGNEKGLWFEDGMGNVNFLKIEKFVSFLASKHIKLLFLSSCLSETIAQQIVQLYSIPIIAIHGSIENISAQLFAKFFYKSLLMPSICDAFDYAKKIVETNSSVERAFLSRTDSPTVKPHEQFLFFGSNFSLSLKSGGISEHFIPFEQPSPFHNWTQGMENIVNFIERGQDLTKILASFQTHPRVCVIGPPGIGKTALANRLARWFIARNQRPVIWMRITSESMNLGAFLKFLIFVTKMPADSQQSFNSNHNLFFLLEQKKLLDYLKQIPFLLIIDGWDRIDADERFTIWNFLKQLENHNYILLTSTEQIPPSDGLNILISGFMNSNSSCKFLWNVLQNVDYFRNRTTLNQSEYEVFPNLGTQLEGYPQLIITIAQHTKSLSLNQIEKLLNEKPEQLFFSEPDSRQSKGIFERLDYIYNSLSFQERKIFSVCGLFDNIKVSYIKLLYPEMTEFSIMNILHQLIEKSLLNQSANSDSCFTQYHVIREFAKSKLEKTSLEMHYLILELFSQQRSWEYYIDTSHHYIELSLRFNQPNAASQLFQFIRCYVLDKISKCQWDQGIKLVKTTLLVETKFPNNSTRIRLMRLLGMCILFSDKIANLESSLILLNKALELASNCNLSDEFGRILTQIGWNYCYQKKTTHAIDVLLKAWATLTNVGTKETSDFIWIALGLAVSYLHIKDKTNGRAWLIKANQLSNTSLESLNKMPNKNSFENLFFFKYQTYINLLLSQTFGDLEILEKNYVQAEKNHNICLDLASQLSNSYFIAFSLFNLGRVMKKQKKYPQAIEYFKSTLKITKNLSKKNSELLYLNSEIKMKLGKLAEQLNDNSILQIISSNF